MRLDLTAIASAVMAGAVVIITRFLIPFVKAQVEQTHTEDILTQVKVYVQAAEQLLSLGTEKLQYVMEAMQSWLKANKFTIDYDRLRAMVESEVYALNQAITNPKSKGKNTSAPASGSTGNTDYVQVEPDYGDSEYLEMVPEAPVAPMEPEGNTDTPLVVETFPEAPENPELPVEAPEGNTDTEVHPETPESPVEPAESDMPMVPDMAPAGPVEPEESKDTAKEPGGSETASDGAQSEVKPVEPDA